LRAAQPPSRRARLREKPVDGRVEVYAIGSPEQLKKIERELRAGQAVQRRRRSRG